jgi:hypothetical protein
MTILNPSKEIDLPNLAKKPKNNNKMIIKKSYH